MAINTNALKRFAQEARKKLMDQVEAKLDFVLHQDSAMIRENAKLLITIKTEIKQNGKEALIDKVAYTWFNRLVALRFMDANDYQPSGYKIVSAVAGQVSSQILQEAHAGLIPEDLSVDRQQVTDLLDGKLQVNNPDNEAFRLLLIAACNQLHRIFPFLFERIDDYTELLLPDDLTSAFSIVTDIVNGLPDEACEEVEVIGWLYQFYISERKETLISSKKVYKKEDIAPASQLFTPGWIVKYMVDNTLGQVWSEINSDTKVTDSLEFYIKPAYLEQLKTRDKKSIEDIRFFEPCVGSGHILSYAFDVYYKIYEEEGYNPNEIPSLILRKNLWGIDIDPRAAQLAAFVLMMKARQKQRRFFKTVEDDKVQPNIYFYEDFKEDVKFHNASTFGSLIRVEPEDVDKIIVEKDSLFTHNQDKLKVLYQLLGQRYDVVVTNPPYIGSSRMEGCLKQYVEQSYPETKSDLFATFILRCVELCEEDGLTGYMTPFVWMFISSYEKLRREIIDKHFINNLIQLEYSGFDGATVPICTFTLRNKIISGGKGSYIRLSDYKGSINQAPKTLEAIQNQDCGWFYTAAQKDFEKIPGIPISYWASNDLLKTLDNPLLGEFLNTSQGMKTLNNERFVRNWSEVSLIFSSSIVSKLDDKASTKWFPINHGGDFLKWYGNNESVLNWLHDGYEIKSLAKEKYNSVTRTVTGMRNYFKEGITWTAISSSTFSARAFGEGYLFTNAGMCAFGNKENYLFVLGLLNSKIGYKYLEILSPTLNFGPNQVKKIPIKESNIEIIKCFVERNIEHSKSNWDSKETSWDFQQNELVRINKERDLGLEEAYDLFTLYWTDKFQQLHRNEEKLNKELADIYGLGNELTPNVLLKDITILKTELNPRELKKISESYQSGWKLKHGTWILEKQKEYPLLPFDVKEILTQFMSYAVGCMFGRYSLDKEGLILANQGETLQEYLKKVGFSEENLHFIPDKDNIIPVLDDEWFEDDIVGKFNDFLRASFGEQNYHKNRAFIEEALGRDIRSFFIRDFYGDHSKRYKKRPIYWQFSSPKKHFTVMIYMHRYSPDTLNKVLNDYLRPFMERVAAHQNQLKHSKLQGSASEQARIEKEIDRLQAILEDCQKYESEILFPLASERIPIDLDDGVLVNYNKFGDAIAPIAGLNDKKAKEKVRKFDWIDTSTIR